MIESRKPIDILLAEDDEDDYLLIADALKESRLANRIYWVKDGEELMDYLHRQGDYSNPEASPSPGIILLDLNMPRKDGREALREIKSEPGLRRIPIIILTTSQAEEDILRSYDLGVNSFIRKPVRFEDFIEMVQVLGKYWFQIVELPGGH
jgi:two-component system, response regulator